MSWLGLDIGSSHLKFANGSGFARSYPLTLNKDSRSLTPRLRMAIAELPDCSHLAVTMSGEAADCFESKADGVRYILRAVQEASDGRHTRVYLVDGRMVVPAIAERTPPLVASANWHALGRLVGRIVETGPALLVDIGSTTTDVVRLMDGLPIAEGTTDIERMISRELVYTGIERSPVCALVQSAPYRDQQCPIAHEMFATTDDVYVILGEVREDPAKRVTADGRPATKRTARVRLGRMISADPEGFNHRDAVAIAHAVADAQAQLISEAIQQVISRGDPPEKVVLSGHGEFLAARALNLLGIEADRVSLAKSLGVLVSRCATAHAVAVIAQDASSG